MLYSAAAVALLAPLVFAAPTENLLSRQAATSLNEVFVGHGKKYFGVCSDQGRLTADKNADIIKADFGQVTPENSGKWDTTECMYSLAKEFVKPDTDNRSIPGQLQLRWTRLSRRLGLNQRPACPWTHDRVAQPASGMGFGHH